MTKLQKLILDITRVRAVKIKQGQTLREKDILYSFGPGIPMARPWSPMPDVKSMRIKVNTSDLLLSYYGVSKKLTPQLDFDPLSRRIRAGNRYLRIMEYRLEKLLWNHDGHGFWILALMLMSQSKVLRLVALRKLDINWFRKWSFNKILRFIKALDRKVESLDMTSFIIRHYVPKGETSWRPIGSPSYPDRMFLYLWQCFFVMFFTTYISSSQHAYRPGQGVNTALADLEKHLADPKWEYVWEFDLKGAFPSTHVVNTCFELARRGVPHQIASLIQSNGLSTIERVDLALMPRMLEEPKFDIQAVLTNLKLPKRVLRNAFTMEGHLFVGFLATATASAKNVGERMARLFSEPDLAKSQINDIEDKAEIAIGPREAPDELIRQLVKFVPMHAAARGFPQGSGLSPILFNFAFETMMHRVHLLNKTYLTNGEIKVISYADDFVVFSTKPIPWKFLTDMPFKPITYQDRGLGQIPWDQTLSDARKELDKWEGMYNEIAMLNQLETRDLGLRVSPQKSRETKVDGGWINRHVKFLGTTFTMFNSISDIMVKSNTRTGKSLSMDNRRTAMVEHYELREETLKSLRGLLDHEFFRSSTPQGILDAYGFGNYPACLLPLELIKSGVPLTATEIQDINNQIQSVERTTKAIEANPDMLSDFDHDNDIKRTIVDPSSIPGEGFVMRKSLGGPEDLGPSALLIGNEPTKLLMDPPQASASHKGAGGSLTGKGWRRKIKDASTGVLNSIVALRDKVLNGSYAGKASQYLQSRIGGKVQSALFAGSWVDPGEITRQPKVTNPGSWKARWPKKAFGKYSTAGLRSEYKASLYSDSSYAGLDLLESMRARPAGMKVVRV